MDFCGGYYKEEGWEDLRWDCCGSMQVDADGNASLVIWDEDFSKDDPLAEINLTISESNGDGEMGAAIVESGYFMDMQLKHADFILDPHLYDYENFLVFDDSYKDEVGNFSLVLYMRPWGQDWSDVSGEHTMRYTDMLPFYYQDWYLPMIEAGAPMPDVIGGGDVTAPGEVPDDEMEPQPTGDYGMSTAEADGVTSLDILIATGKYVNEHRTEVTYEDVYNMMGYINGKALIDGANWREGNGHTYQWSCPHRRVPCHQFQNR